MVGIFSPLTYYESSQTNYNNVTVGISNAVVQHEASNYAFITSGISVVLNADGEKVYAFTIWDGTQSIEVQTEDRYQIAGDTANLGKGGAIAYVVVSDGIIDVIDSYAANASTEYETTGSYARLREAAIVSYNPEANNDGDYAITLITDDTTVLFVDRDGGKRTGMEAGDIVLATESAMEGTHYTNASYIYKDAAMPTPTLALLVIEVSNNYSDGAM